MSLSLPELQATAELAKHLYDYLPGSSGWGSTYTLAHAAQESGVGDLWAGGSKLPALTRLLERTLDMRRISFCPLVERIVRNGISYRLKKNSPLTRTDIDALNAVVKKVGFKIPALWDPAFLAALPAGRPNSQPVEPVRESKPEPEEKLLLRLPQLRDEFLQLQAIADRNAAGLLLERLLGTLFELHGLEPNQAFRVTGEQIDGSFVLDNSVYLLEAKWTSPPTPASELMAFRGKVEGKSSFTRGLFISINGFSGPAVQAITRGKQPNFVMMDGADLFRVLEGHVRLDDILRRKLRILGDRGEPFVPVSVLFSDGRR